MISEAHFHALAKQGYNRIPLVREVLADLDTPLSAYLKVVRGPFAYLFESVQGGEQWGRYSIIGLPARERLEVRAGEVQVFVDDTLTERCRPADPLDWIRAYHRRFRVPQSEDVAGRFAGGLVGYFGFDTVRYIEPRLQRAPRLPDPLDLPEIQLLVAQELLVFDNLRGTLRIIVHADPAERHAYERARARVEALAATLRDGSPVPPAAATRKGRVREEDYRASFSREAYMAAVERIRDYIAAGDVMQVVPSQRLSIPLEAHPLDLYRALRGVNPSPYLFYLDLGKTQLVGSSPEILVRVEDGRVTVRPIAGTRPRGVDLEHDLALEQELLADAKERAEHLMLIDLARNDVGRIAEVGSVHLDESFGIERYSHVMHIVSEVSGRLRPGLDAMDALRAAFPAGTVSGAPKIRAMEIIRELEPVSRGIYAGAVGYWGFNGNLDTCIAIRTGVVQDGELHIQAGGGIVADSKPASEWEETMNKRRAMFRAVDLAENGLDPEVGVQR
ncbi:anthranilate synthase component I [Acidithiobacillus caldus]|uniref:Anthranilate synthase component 1 n=1 Tax=Acidithiobacillus caldus (strain ATCC 51756 / DSM 8584 / KU) TaxID=637389 RepID=A0A059ZVH8_ACICK|nr:anthranilate synthase component I [Acidithiobacillus caldus]AIA53966.1 Anthranilate synthase, aminase component [Acidithiobacillus caldus ATCC 51756]MBU2731169.1 anthranilate synthase component I [Acidithiobacillus caldus]MBU2736708.1 anthranilate synthase component I [Acidithiobacillus caldus ATCC 51756]MBU2745666.1 anthranilate synthase component I [Acidithiobacillus caldus]MBU2780800.1 anthranilate synthase component I [Acidithiobacillus caldus]